MKKALLILIAVVLPPVLASLALVAAGEWRSVGETGAGDRVSISSVRVLKKNQRLALVRVEYKEPAKLPQGGPFVEVRARVRFNCNEKTASPTALWFYAADRSGRPFVSKKTYHDDQFGQALEGGFADLATKAVCETK